MKKPWTVNFPTTLFDRLRSLSEAERRPLNTQIIMAVEAGLEKLDKQRQKLEEKK